MRSLMRLVAILTPLLILAGCSGGSGGAGTIAASIGTICNESDSRYTISVDGESARAIDSSLNPLLDSYVGSIGGQIRAVDSLAISDEGEALVRGMVWNLGGSVRYGLLDELLGTIPLKRPGAVTGISHLRVDGKTKVVYGTEWGLGLMSIQSDKLVDNPQYFRSVPARNGVISGVLSVDAMTDGGLVAFTTADGYLQTTTISALMSKEKCTDVAASATALKVGDQSYLPVKVRLGGGRAFILAKAPSALTTIAPTFKEAYWATFKGMVSDFAPATVRAAVLSDHRVLNAGFTAADGSMSSFDGFIPTDISTDGEALFVAGVAFRSAGVQSYLAQKCSSASDDSAKIECLLEGAKGTSLVTFLYKDVSPLGAGILIYRNLDDLSKATHFEMVPLTSFKVDADAPPFSFRIAEYGGKGYVRGPNFLLPVSRSDDGTSDENWTLGSEIDADSGFIPGLPNDLILFDDGAISASTAVKDDDGAGFSALDYVDSKGAFTLLDAGGISVRVEGGGVSSSGTLIAAIEMENAAGGTLYLENPTSRTAISDIEYDNAYVSRAAYDGTSLAFAWSSKGADDTPEWKEKWRFAVQRGADSSTRSEEFSFFRRGDSKGIFDGFPEISASTSEPTEVRGIGDLNLPKGSNMLAVLFAGHDGNSWYLQPALISFASASSGRYGKPAISAVGATMGPISGLMGGRILKVASSGSATVVTFAGPDGIYTWTAGDGAAAQKISGMQGGALISAAIDPVGKKNVAAVSGFKVDVRDLTKPSSTVSFAIPKASGYSGSAAVGARVAIIGNGVYVATPRGVASAPLLIYDLSKGASQTPSACAGCNYIDVSAFEADPRYLLANGAGSGVEIYKVGD